MRGFAASGVIGNGVVASGFLGGCCCALWEMSGAAALGSGVALAAGGLGALLAFQVLLAMAVSGR